MRRSFGEIEVLDRGLHGVGGIADGDHVPMRAEVLAENRVVRLAYFATLVTAAVSVVSDSKLEATETHDEFEVL